MSFSLVPVDINVDKWRVLVERMNELITAANTIVISTNSNPTVGSAVITGSFSANALYDSNVRVVTEARTITTGTGLAGGGNLANNLTVALNANTASSLAKADSALQTADFTGKIGLKTKVDITDLNTLGTANSTTFLSGSGTWVQITNAGDMRANTYDPTGKNADAFNLANMHGKLTLSAPGAEGAPLKFTEGTPATANAGDVWFESNTLVIRAGSANNTLFHSGNLLSANSTTGVNSSITIAYTWSPSIIAQAVNTFGVSNTAFTANVNAIANNISSINTKIGNGPVGYGQTWTDFTVSGRVLGTSYQNTTGSSIYVAVWMSSTSGVFEVSPNNTTWVSIGYNGTGFAIIPNGHYYRASSGVSINRWVELRA